MCPVCKGGVEKADLIPVFSRGADKEKSYPGIPKRPPQHKIAPAPIKNRFFGALGGNVFPGRMYGRAPPLDADEEVNAWLIRMFLLFSLSTLLIVVFWEHWL